MARLTFDKATESAYGAWDAARKRPLIQGALVMASAIFVLTYVGEAPVLPDPGGAILGARLAVTAVLLGLLAASFIPWLAARPGAILVTGVVAASLGSSYISTFYGENAAFRTVATHFAFGIFVVALSPSFRAVLISAVLLFALPNVVFFAALEAKDAQLAANLMLFFGCAVIAVLGYFIDQDRRQVFWANAQLQQMARTDVLTGVFNRRHVMEVAEREVERALRFERAISLLILDIDHFKRINDTYGHQAGDVVIKAMAQAVESIVRRIDSFGRIGGEEFVAVLPDTDASQAMILAERIRIALSELDVVAEGKRIRFTVSVGVADLDEDHATVDTILKSADEALYLAKQSGRNRALRAA